jgi:hypothetical protein
MDHRNKCSSTVQKNWQPEKYLYVPGGDICDWIVYDQGEVAFLTIGRVWYQRQDHHGNNNFVSIGPASPSIILTIPDVDELCWLDVTTHLCKKPVYEYKDILVELLGLTPSKYKYLSIKHPTFPELHQYEDDMDWIVFDGPSPAFLVKGDWMTGYEWYQRIRPTATYQCINPLTLNHVETTRTSRMIDMSYYHLNQISHHDAMDYNTFCTVEKVIARCQQRDCTEQIEKLKSEKLKLGIMLAQMYAGGSSMPPAPTTNTEI